MARVFQTGQVVRLKSGGYRMTVSDPLRFNEDWLIDVQWHDKEGHLLRDCIHQDCLELFSGFGESPNWYGKNKGYTKWSQY